MKSEKMALRTLVMIVCAPSTILAANTWTGTGDWNTAANWSEGVPRCLPHAAPVGQLQRGDHHQHAAARVRGNGFSELRNLGPCQPGCPAGLGRVPDLASAGQLADREVASS